MSAKSVNLFEPQILYMKKEGCGQLNEHLIVSSLHAGIYAPFF
jgi:hypothetical protein